VIREYVARKKRRGKKGTETRKTGEGQKKKADYLVCSHKKRKFAA
jgi:hypothetical protein